MKNRTYFIFVSIIFTIVTTLHLARIFLDWPVRIGTWDIPMWASWLAVALAGALAYHGFRFQKRG